MMKSEKSFHKANVFVVYYKLLMYCLMIHLDEENSGEDDFLTKESSSPAFRFLYRRK